MYGCYKKRFTTYEIFRKCKFWEVFINCRVKYSGFRHKMDSKAQNRLYYLHQNEFTYNPPEHNELCGCN